MIRAVLVDDEPPARVRMRQLLAAAGDVTVVGEAGSADRGARGDSRHAARPAVSRHRDARSARHRAGRVAPRAAAVHRLCDRVRSTTRSTPSRVDATDYLLKPVSRIKLAATLDRVRARLATQTVERDIAAASDVQAHMWPGALPRIPGFDCAAASLPARGVGGDFYDCVSDLDAGGCTGAMHGALGVAARRRVGQGRGGRPGRLRRAGARPYRGHARAARPRSHDGRGRSGRLRHHRRRALRDRDLRRARCRRTAGSRSSTPGHPPVLVLPPGSGDGDASRRHRARAGLDRSRRVSARTRVHARRPAPCSSPYTDGVNEALNEADEEFGDERLAACSRTAAIERAAELCTAILDAVRALSAAAAGSRRRHRDGGEGPMIRTLLVDDEQPARERLRQLLAAHPEVEVVGEAEDGVQAAEQDRRAHTRSRAARHPDAGRQRPRCGGLARQAAAGGDLLHRVRSVRGRCVRAVGARLPAEAGQPRAPGGRARSRARRARPHGTRSRARAADARHRAHTHTLPRPARHPLPRGPRHGSGRVHVRRRHHAPAHRDRATVDAAHARRARAPARCRDASSRCRGTRSSASMR